MTATLADIKDAKLRLQAEVQIAACLDELWHRARLERPTRQLVGCVEKGDSVRREWHQITRGLENAAAYSERALAVAILLGPLALMWSNAKK